MLYLQRFDEGHLSWQAPLADCTAAALERALLAGDDTSRLAELTSAIVSDPALAIWVAHQAQHSSLITTTTAVEAAEWLGCGLAEKLAHAIGVLPPLSPSAAQHFAAVAANTVSAAHCACADDANFARANSAAYWAALLDVKGQLLSDRPTDDHDPGQSDKQLVDYFLAAEPGIQQRLPALLTRLADCERRLAEFDRRLEEEKLAALKELAYGASHEINNPLANIAARAQTLLQDETDPERRRMLLAIHRQAMRAHEMIADLMLFARPPQLVRTSCDAGQLVRQVVEEMADLAAEREIQLACDLCEQPVVLDADPTQLAVAVQAVIVNSLEAVGTGGHVVVQVAEQSAGDERWAEIMVRDDGPGISADVRPHIFDPFFSGREAGRGLGFGLSKCWRIVTDHGGRIIVVNAPRGGAQLALLLPLAHRVANTSAND